MGRLWRWFHARPWLRLAIGLIGLAALTLGTINAWRSESSTALIVAPRCRRYRLFPLAAR